MKKIRLNKLFELIPEALVIADVGCDHGYLTELLAKSNRFEKIIASDISDICLDKTKQRLKKQNCENGVLFIKSDGFINYPKDLYPKCAIIAGLGGEEIVKILQKHPQISSLECVILQPMNKCEIVRDFLQGEFCIIFDDIVQESSKFYCVLMAKYGNPRKLSDCEIEFGTNTEHKKSEDYISWLQYKIQGIDKILANKCGGSEELLQKREMLNRLKRGNYE